LRAALVIPATGLTRRRPPRLASRRSPFGRKRGLRMTEAVIRATTELELAMI
jgi:hypothetical protein